jgi:hypothetical protein
MRCERADTCLVCSQPVMHSIQSWKVFGVSVRLHHSTTNGHILHSHGCMLWIAFVNFTYRLDTVRSFRYQRR